MCLKKFETTIQETKQAIDKNYLVLGVLEELKVKPVLFSVDNIL